MKFGKTRFFMKKSHFGIIIETFSEDKMPEDLKKIHPTKPGSSNLSK